MLLLPKFRQLRIIKLESLNKLLILSAAKYKINRDVGPHKTAVKSGLIADICIFSSDYNADFILKYGG